jgi:hypothetical protein
MPQYIIKWNYGFGDNFQEVEADNLEDAVSQARAEWLEGAESEACWNVIEGREADDDLRARYLE